MIRPWVALVVGALALASPAGAQVDCSNPDNLCTGDPCVIPTVEVATPCTVDFSPRAVVVAGTLTVPGGGALSFTADRIEVQGAMVGSPYGSAALSATGDIDVGGPIENLILTVDASGSVHLRDAIILPGGTVTFHAGGDIDIDPRALIRVTSTDSGGVITLEANGNINAEGRLQANTRSPIYTGEVKATAGGMLSIANPVRVKEGHAALSGAAGVTIGAPVNGWDLEASSTTGNVRLNGLSQFRNVTVDAGGDAVLGGRFRGVVSAHSSLSVTAGGAATFNGNLVSRYADIHMSGATGQVSSDAFLNTARGSLRFSATAGDLTLSGTFLARGRVIEGMASGNLTADGVFRATFGCIGLSAGGTLDTSAGSFDAPIVPDCPGT